jgi:beta-glucanase (GH16 family)
MYGRLRHARGDSRPAGRSRRAGQRRWPAVALAAPVIALGAPAAATAASQSPASGSTAASPASVAVPAVASMAAAVGATASRADAAVGRVPAPPPGWSTEFADDFNGPARSKPSAAKWHYDVGPGSSFGTGEIETMTNSTRNGYLNGRGHLHLTALDHGGSWTSARIQTNTANVGAPPGGELEVTASIRQPSPAGGLGYWPAFWMLGPGQWPENGEIDIMEDVNALSELSGTIHCGTYPGGRCNEPNGVGSGLRPCPGCQGGYHTYTMILNRTSAARQSITFYLDGRRYFRVRESKVGAAVWRAAFDHKLSIIFDLAMGGGYPNGVCGCTTPTGSTSSGGTMSVAYVAAYTRAG